MNEYFMIVRTYNSASVQEGNWKKLNKELWLNFVVAGSDQNLRFYL